MMVLTSYITVIMINDHNITNYDSDSIRSNTRWHLHHELCPVSDASIFSLSTVDGVTHHFHERHCWSHDFRKRFFQMHRVFAVCVINDLRCWKGQSCQWLYLKAWWTGKISVYRLLRVWCIESAHCCQWFIWENGSTAAGEKSCKWNGLSEWACSVPSLIMFQILGLLTVRDRNDR